MARDHSRPVKPARQELLRARVLARTEVSAGIVRLTIGGGELGRFAPMGFDQWFRLFFPRDGQTEFRLPGRGDMLGYAQFLATPRSIRPHMRNYSARAVRSGEDGVEIDVDVVRHAGGTASTWAETVEPGARVAILDEGIGFDPPADAEWHMLVGDETAIPAIAGICASLPTGARGVAIIEVAREDDRQEFRAPTGLDLRWIVRDAARPGVAALDAVRSATLPPGRGYAFCVGEAALATGARRHLVADRGFAKGDVAFCGYWRLPA